MSGARRTSQRRLEATKVVVSLVVTTLQISELPVLDSVYNQIAEIFFDTLFFLEFLCRFFSAPSKMLGRIGCFTWRRVLL